MPHRYVEIVFRQQRSFLKSFDLSAIRKTKYHHLFSLFQSGLPALNVEILSQFPSPPLPNLPALAMAMAPVMPQHQQPMMTQPPVSMAMPTPAPPVMAMVPAALAQPPTNTNFIASFPPAQVKQSCLQFGHFPDTGFLTIVTSYSLTHC